MKSIKINKKCRIPAGGRFYFLQAAETKCDTAIETMEAIANKSSGLSHKQRQAQYKQSLTEFSAIPESFGGSGSFANIGRGNETQPIPFPLSKLRQVLQAMLSYDPLNIRLMNRFLEYSAHGRDLLLLENCDIDGTQGILPGNGFHAELLGSLW